MSIVATASVQGSTSAHADGSTVNVVAESIRAARPQASATDRALNPVRAMVRLDPTDVSSWPVLPEMMVPTQAPANTGE